MNRAAAPTSARAVTRVVPAARPRLVLRDDLRDADGMPRIGLDLPGRRTLLAFPSVSAAVAALNAMEAAR